MTTGVRLLSSEALIAQTGDETILHLHKNLPNSPATASFSLDQAMKFDYYICIAGPASPGYGSILVRQTASDISRK